MTRTISLCNLSVKLIDKGKGINNRFNCREVVKSSVHSSRSDYYIILIWLWKTLFFRSLFSPIHELLWDHYSSVFLFYSTVQRVLLIFGSARIEVH